MEPELQPAVPYGGWDATGLDTDTGGLERLLFEELFPELNTPQSFPECARCGGPTQLDPAFSPVLFRCPVCD